MKKLILIISLFIVGTSFGQTLDIVNNTSIDITVEYMEYDENPPFCTNPSTVISITVPAGTSTTGIGLTFTTFPTNRFLSVRAMETSTGIRDSRLLTTQFSGCHSYQGIAMYSAFSIPVTGTWTEDPGTNDVDIEFN